MSSVGYICTTLGGKAESGVRDKHKNSGWLVATAITPASANVDLELSGPRLAPSFDIQPQNHRSNRANPTTSRFSS